MYNNIFIINILLLFALTACDTGTHSKQSTEPVSSSTASAPDLVLGATLFAKNCAACHGQGGLGSDQGPSLINRIYQPSHHDDFSFYRAVSSGSRQHHWQFGDMPPLPDVRIEDVAHIIAYVRKEQRNAGIQ